MSNRLDLNEINYPRDAAGFYDNDRMGIALGRGFKVVAEGGNIAGHGHMGGHWCPPYLLEWAATAADRIFSKYGVDPNEALIASQCDRNRVGGARRFFSGRETRKWIDCKRKQIVATDEAVAAARRCMEYGFSCSLQQGS